MNTPAHLVVGVALCSRRGVPKTGWMAALGSLLPDLSLYILAGVSLFVLQIPPQRVFDELYFSDGWQAVFAVDNSIVIWGLVLVIALFRRSDTFSAFAAAGLLHVVTDFFLHNDDARPHFWPISDWVFQSPVSYWDSAHHAALVAPVTTLIVLLSAYVIWTRWPTLSIRIGLLAVCCLEVWVVRQWLMFF